MFLGAFQQETSSLTIGILILGFIAICSLHLITAFKERKIDNAKTSAKEGWLKVCDIIEIEEKLLPGVEGVSQLKYRSVGETFVSNGQIVQKTLGDILNMVSRGDLDFTTAAKVLQENWFPRVPLPISLPRPVTDEEDQARIQRELEEAANIQR